jgi:hypothetical protein
LRVLCCLRGNSGEGSRAAQKQQQKPHTVVVEWAGAGHLSGRLRQGRVLGGDSRAGVCVGGESPPKLTCKCWALTGIVAAAAAAAGLLFPTSQV